MVGSQTLWSCGGPHSKSKFVNREPAAAVKSFTGVEIGILQSIREIPGFLAFTIIFLLFYFKEQYFAIFSLDIN